MASVGTGAGAVNMGDAIMTLQHGATLGTPRIFQSRANPIAEPSPASSVFPWPTSAMLNPQASSTPPSTRYGSGARSAPRGERERDRDIDPRRRFPSRGRDSPRAEPAGREERADWLAALENFTGRLEALEANGRTQAQRGANSDDKITQLVDRVPQHEGAIRVLQK